MSECSCLASETAAVNGSDNIEAAECSCKFERSSDFVLNDIFLAEVSIDVSLVDDDVACSRKMATDDFLLPVA